MDLNSPQTVPTTVTAFAKINLYLHVTGRRDNGYHELDSLIAFAGVGDSITIEADDTLSLSVSGLGADTIPQDDNNLVMQAAHTLARHSGNTSGARITLVKNLPAAAGIGGGSADAAAALLGLAKVWNLDMAPRNLTPMALALGADVPICVYGKAALVRGIGEVMTPSPKLPPAWLVLTNPDVPVETASVFKQRTGPFSSLDPLTESPENIEEFVSVLKARQNDLTEAACEIAPAITETLKTLQDCPGSLMSRLSGSGATCFALFADEPAATTAAQAIRQAHPAWWAEAAPLLTNTTEIRMETPEN